MDAAPLERINLNVPREVRLKVKALARQRGQTEAETARRLLMRALDEVDRKAFYQAAIDSMTPERRERELRILRAFERGLGKTR